jgi:DNA-binding transcriptional MerR regulator
MSLDQRTIVVAQISAAVACNALAALRLAVTEALTIGLSPEEIREILALVKEIQQQPISHVAHLTDQLLRESKKTAHQHSAHCDCGRHHG